MRSVVGTSRVGVFARASAGRFLKEILGVWRELSGEMLTIGKSTSGTDAGFQRGAS